MIKGIFFDLGGTLFRYGGRMGGGGIRFVVNELGISADPDEIGNAWRNASSSVGASYGRQRYFLHKDLFQDTLRAFLAQFDHQPNADLLEEFHQQQLASMLQHLPIRDECHDALRELKELGLYLSIVSNIDDDYLDPLVTQHDLDAYLTHWTSSEEAQSCKPDPDIYHYALSKSGLALDDVLFVGDSLQHDVAGADAVGMQSVRIVEEGVITPLTHGLEITAEPNHEITSLLDLVPLVARLNGIEP